jgi:hypothetical protein
MEQVTNYINNTPRIHQYGSGDDTSETESSDESAEEVDIHKSRALMPPPKPPKVTHVPSRRRPPLTFAKTSPVAERADYFSKDKEDPARTQFSEGKEYKARAARWIRYSESDARADVAPQVHVTVNNSKTNRRQSYQAYMKAETEYVRAVQALSRNDGTKRQHKIRAVEADVKGAHVGRPLSQDVAEKVEAVVDRSSNDLQQTMIDKPNTTHDGLQFYEHTTAYHQPSTPLPAVAAEEQNEHVKENSARDIDNEFDIPVARPNKDTMLHEKHVGKPSDHSSAIQDNVSNRSVTFDTSSQQPGTPQANISVRPTLRLSEDPESIREGLTPHRLKGKDIPVNARWTKIDRRLVNPQALEESKERFEERHDCVIVLRVLSKEEIQELADLTQRIRERRGMP